MIDNETICALATAPGGALGIIRISGPQSLGILSRISSKNLTDAAPNTIHYGHIRNGDEILDEVLVSVFRAPHSYTGEDSAEISCHGSRHSSYSATPSPVQTASTDTAATNHYLIPAIDRTPRTPYSISYDTLHLPSHHSSDPALVHTLPLPSSRRPTDEPTKSSWSYTHPSTSPPAA